MSEVSPLAPALYVGRVMHHRMKPKVHRFTYDVFSCLIDLDRLEAADRSSKVFSVDCFNLLAFHQRDHGDGLSRDLASTVRARLAQAGLADAGHAIFLLAYPRVLGFVFNPLSIYYCYKSDRQLAAMLYEVSNTFGERHMYVVPVENDERAERDVRHDCDKTFYVSPFLDMPMRYGFRLTPPSDTLRFRILEKDAEGPILAAVFSASRKPFTTQSLLRAFLGLPLMTAKVVAAIHWQAFRLWLKGVPLVPKPATVSAHSLAHRPPELAHGHRDAS